MRVLLPATIRGRLRDELIAAGTAEIGGVLMGEHVGTNEFRVVDLTIQQKGGSFARFLRAVADAVVALRDFFRRTESDFRRFNYLGEWHSHPSFPPSPSATDIATITEIATDESVGANFVVLVIVRLESGEVEGTATLFLPDGTNRPAALEVEEAA